MKRNNRLLFLLVLMLLFLSLLKDRITPDYLNTPEAAFLNPEMNHGQGNTSIFSHSFYWLLSFLYSIAFVLLPYLIVKILFTRQLALYTLGALIAIGLLEYALVFSSHEALMKHLLPKVNRYFHSPILLLFCIAAFTLNNRKHGSD